MAKPVLNTAGAVGVVEAAGAGIGAAAVDAETALMAPVTLALAFESAPPVGESRGLPPGLVLSLSNQSGHRWPTGFPGRLAQVVLVGHDAVGAAVWAPPPTPLGRGFADAEGQPTLAAFAVRQTHDTRLNAGETRSLRWPLPAEVQTVEATVKLWLVAPPAAHRLGLTDTPEAKPRVVAREVWRR